MPVCSRVCLCVCLFAHRFVLFFLSVLSVCFYVSSFDVPGLFFVYLFVGMDLVDWISCLYVVSVVCLRLSPFFRLSPLPSSSFEIRVDPGRYLQPMRKMRTENGAKL